MNRKLNTSELNRPTVEESLSAKKIPVIAMLENIRSGLNVGSIFRSADSFSIEQVICCGYTPCPPQRDVLKTALGATMSVRWSVAENCEQAIQTLKTEGYVIYAVEQTTGSISLNQFVPPTNQKIVLVFGNEVAGVSQQALNLCDGAIQIDQAGFKHSLNVAVCAGIVFYQLHQKLN